MVEQNRVIGVEVAFALPEKQVIRSLTVAAGTTAEQAVEQSGITRQFPGVDFLSLAMGIFSRPLDGVELPLPGEYVLQAGDRVEIYRPLVMDPKQARLERARRGK
jgi:putative ubiquitin-RnfH superfamily antitoxin RatB of RatAB toxin-antitoxin module